VKRVEAISSLARKVRTGSDWVADIFTGDAAFASRVTSGNPVRVWCRRSVAGKEYHCHEGRE